MKNNYLENLVNYWELPEKSLHFGMFQKKELVIENSKEQSVEYWEFLS